jgi:hypothetical protein
MGYPNAPMPPDSGMAPPPSGSDNTTLFGVLGIIFGICFWPLGILFSVLALVQANKWNKPKTLAIIGFVLCALSLIFGFVYIANR